MVKDQTYYKAKRIFNKKKTYAQLGIMIALKLLPPYVTKKLF